MPRHLAILVPLSVVLVAACSSAGGSGTTSSGSPGPTSSSVAGTGGMVGGGGGGDVTASSTVSSSAGTGGSDAGPIGGDRPVSVEVPFSYTPGTPAPLLLLLHGYGATGALEDVYLGVNAEAAKRGMLYAHPDGLVDSSGQHYWNASDACCAFDANPPDDSAYLSQVIKDISAHYTVDPKRIFLMGHSNGAFMSYRMACDHADQIAAIVSLAGAMPNDVTKCNPSGPVSVLEIHGTADTVIAYDGASINGNPFPGALTSVTDWVKLDACSATADTSAPPLDLEATLPGAETSVTKFAGCKSGSHAELWTITGGSHIPTITPNFTPDALDYLVAHPKQ